MSGLLRFAASRLGSVPRWARRPILPAIVLAGAVAVSVAEGQPPPADPASGQSVPVRAAATSAPDLGRMLLVSNGTLASVDVDTGLASAVPLPAGQFALRAWPMPGADVVLTRPTPAASAATGAETGSPTRAPDLNAVPDGTAPAGPTVPRADGTTTERTPRVPPDTVAYALPDDGPPVALGPTTAVVPGADEEHVWLLDGDVARLVGLDGADTGTWVRVPPSYALIGATAEGPIATIGGSEPTTVLLPTDGGLPRWLTNARAFDVSGGLLLTLDRDGRVGQLNLATGVTRTLPRMAAVSVTGPGRFSADHDMFAALARVNDHARLVVGPMDATSANELRVLPLDGGPPSTSPAPPVWTPDGRVLTVRPDGRTVFYQPGDRYGSVLSLGLPVDGITPINTVDATGAAN